MTRKITMKSALMVTLSLLCSFSVMAGNGYKIKVQFTDVDTADVILCHYFGKGSTVYKDDSTTLIKGKGSLSSTEKITGGIYLLLFKDKSANIEFILNNGDDIDLRVAKNNIIPSAVFKGKNENTAFYEYQKYLVEYGKGYQILEDELATCKTLADTNKVYDKMRNKAKELSAYRKAFIQKNPNTFMRKIFLAVEDPDIPTELPVKEDGSRDSSYPSRYYKNHYWDDYDFQDERLMYTPLYDSKLSNYMDKWVIPVPDTVKQEMDWLLKKAEGAPETFKYTLWFLSRWTETSKIMGMDEAFVYLVENYHMKGKATWIDSAQLAKYIDRARKIAPNMIGQPAMDIRMLDTSLKTVTLYSIPARYTLLIFWSPDCGHCKKEIPVFDSLYHAELKKYGVRIFGIDAELDTEKWKEFIRDHQLYDGWIHGHDPGHQSNFRAFYDVYSTPTVYLLDENKTIVGKRLDPHNLLGLIEYLEKKKKEENK